MNRQAALDDLVERFVMNQWITDLALIESEYERRQAEIESAFLAAFDEACKQSAMLQQTGGKGKAVYIYISLLRTQVMEGRAGYRIEVYDENWFMDRQDCAGVWEADFIFQPLFARMEALKGQLGQYARKVTVMDIDQMIQLELITYHTLTIELLKEMVPRLLPRSEWFESMVRSDALKILAGEYRDASELLYHCRVTDENRQTQELGADAL
ncbi:hypothetical protein [Paenibacillus sp. MMS18-CY102]|uniref:hypothetical protein n=1 Tax=Paenibacillus sp. MMS18-CY102 TaxID=2682849 RepID=UPI001920CA80|nr:hypothetical protein [Paenibacillus sp. MMS18-CY102]